MVCCVGFNFEQVLTTLVVEPLNEVPIPFEGIGSGEFHHIATFPEASRAAEGGDAAFGGDASACQDDDVREMRVVSH